MAWPPRQSRSRSSRRDQNRALLGYVVTGVAIVAGILLLLMSRATPERADALRGAAVDALAPAWAIARMPFEALGAIGDYVSDYFFAISRNRRLEAEYARFQLTQQQFAAVRAENAQLKRLLRVVEPRVQRVGVFRIAGASSGSYVRSAVISAGRRHGVAVGQPVRTVEGIVGRIVETGDSAARVLLLSDTNSRVPVRIQRTGKPAMIAGINGALLEVRFVAPADGQLRIGDKLVTSGDGGIYPPEIPVATVVRLRGETIYARPAANPEALGFVIVDQPYLPVVLPPSAPATPTMLAMPNKKLVTPVAPPAPPPAAAGAQTPTTNAAATPTPTAAPATVAAPPPTLPPTATAALASQAEEVGE